VATGALLLSAMLGVAALFSRLREPTVPVFDPDIRLEQVDQALENLTPRQGWQMWVDLYRPMAEQGFAIFQDPHKPAIEQYVARQRFFQKTLLIVAATSVVIAIAAVLWPRSTTTRRQGDKETRSKS
jgi:hypothetical protein